MTTSPFQSNGTTHQSGSWNLFSCDSFHGDRMPRIETWYCCDILSERTAQRWNWFRVSPRFDWENKGVNPLRSKLFEETKLTYNCVSWYSSTLRSNSYKSLSQTQGRVNAIPYIVSNMTYCMPFLLASSSAGIAFTWFSQNIPATFADDIYKLISLKIPFCNLVKTLSKFIPKWQ